MTVLRLPFTGTLLGWFRECSQMRHAKDVDIGVLATEFQPEMIVAMEQQGLRLSHRFGVLSDSFELSFEGPGGVKLDVFFFYIELDHAWNGGTQARTGRKFKYRFPLFELCLAFLAGTHVRVPCDPLAFVLANYGEGWHTPAEQWDWKHSPPNVRPNGAWHREDWPFVIQCDVCVTKVNRDTPIGPTLGPGRTT